MGARMGRLFELVESSAGMWVLFAWWRLGGMIGAAGGVTQLASSSSVGRCLHTGGWPLGESPSWPSGVLVIRRE